MFLAKVSFNSNHWIKPSGPTGKLISNQFVDFYECRYGFGWEEWNFSPNRVLDSLHYGFLQGIHSNSNLRGKTFKDVYIFTQKSDLNYYLIGSIKNLYALKYFEGSESRQRLNHLPIMREDVKSVGGNLSKFSDDSNISINCRFENFSYFFNDNNLINLKLNLPSSISSFKDIFEINDLRRQNKILDIINSL